jgi:imidazolonepropionase-like amidohydrolase
MEMAAVDSIVAVLTRGGAPDDMLIYRAPFASRLLETQSPIRRRALIASFSSHSTWQTPTLVALPLRTLLARRDTTLSPADRSVDERLLQAADALVRQMWRSGVPILAGTDSPLEQSELVNELDLLVHAGLTPLAALQSATKNAAAFLERSRSGTIAPGQDADLLIVLGNPLSDIRNLDRVDAVILRGEMIRGNGRRP